ncbi:ATP-dependent RNA helicase DEAH11, chloroplastic-like, partial [Camellia sinensis]|uniref:ATP-dependent RNA helicase DEAH11, chloroplastic-like n=1 Tax=Camellia sinensis TaxID=4442 RepID=UPI001036934B
NPTPHNFFVNPTGLVAGILFFRHRTDAAEAIVFFWERRIAGDHFMTPVSEVLDDKLQERVKGLFVSHVESLLEGEVMQRMVKKREVLQNEAENLSARLRKPQKLGLLFGDLPGKAKGLRDEIGLITNRMEEFRSAMKWVLNYLQGNNSKDSVISGETEVFKFEDGLDLSRIHCIVMRECRRLEEGLPIYGFRLEIIRKVLSEQVMVLIGETGSGKSTQLVQFLADSGLGASGSIVCTQPRKIAAVSLAKRVGEETNGCYEGNSIICYPTYSHVQAFKSKVIFMTDHCLLQHYMNNKNLSGISCIIIDEAHERSLNTDLLLALLKELLCQRGDLRLIIMSATVDASKISDYFYGCGTFHVVGRSFPVEINYVPGEYGGTSGTLKSSSGNLAPYVFDVVKMVTEIHKSENEGAILAFLTSHMEVDWARENFQSPSVVSLALHGKLSHEEQCRVFQDYPGKRKVIFATNLAETSLTIPGVKYVIDSGMVKERWFDSSSGMNVLRVSWISQSSANQRAGRAGRTEPGKCYRLYSDCDYQSMLLHQEPEIRKVHLGIAVLRILALGIKNVQEFNFVDAPSAKAIDMAIRNLVQLGAIISKNDAFDLTEDGHCIVKLGIEPRLGKLVLDCCQHQLCREGVILAAVMANASSIFCRVGTSDDKLKADCIKVQFCHRGGDLFTLLSVYKEWECMPRGSQNKWCWENSVNAKSMRRCYDAVLELESCLKNELSITVPSFWLWNPDVVSEHDKWMKKAILSSLAENVAMYSGYDRLGYEVALTGEHFKLHPSCSLLAYGQKPSWVVFSEMLSTPNQYLVCVTAFDYDSLFSISPPPPFNILQLQSRKLQVRVITGFSSAVLKRFRGKSNNSLLRHVSRIQTTFMDERIGIEIDADKDEIHLFASSEDIERVLSLLTDALAYEKKLLRNECLEKCLHHGGQPGVTPPVALFGAGAEIKHLELEQRYLTVDVFHSKVNSFDDKELLIFFENFVSGVCGFHKFTLSGQDGEDNEKWGRITFFTPVAAQKAVELNGVEFCGSSLKVAPAWACVVGDHRMSSFPAVRAKVFWPRRHSKGFAIVKCERNDVDFIVSDCTNILIGGRLIYCEIDRKCMDSVVIRGIDRETSEPEILEILRMATDRKILDLFLVRGAAVDDPPCGSCEAALRKELAPFMPSNSPLSNFCYVKVFRPEPKDNFMKALITFDGRLHLEAAKALHHIEGKALAGCLSWQKIQCQQLFHSSLSCPAPVYVVIKRQLDSLFNSFKHRSGVSYNLERTEYGSYRVKISANATKAVAELRKPLEQLMKGKLVTHDSLTPTILQLLFSREGIMLMKSVQQETGTYIFFDRQNLNVRVFGSEDKVALAAKKLVQSLLTLREDKPLEICLRNRVLPHDLMKKVVEKFGPDIRGLKEKVPEAELTLDVKHHVICVRGSKEVKQAAEKVIYEFACSLNVNDLEEHPGGEASTCPICLCEVEDSYQLAACGHEFCQSCLVEQLESAIKSRDGFPLGCAREMCGEHILLMDLRSLLSCEKLEELFRASLGAFVASSGGKYKFCPSPDCPSVYRVAEPGATCWPFACGACYAETCTGCHLEYHPFISCERYKEFKEDPDSSLKEWCQGKEHVKSCPVCGYMIEKVDGCNHIECRCGKHICWVCLECFCNSDDCYVHLRSVHHAII